MKFLLAVTLCVALTLAAVYAGDAAPPDPATGILRFHRHHTGVDGGKSVLMIQQEKVDALAFDVDMSSSPPPALAVLTFSAGGPKKRSVVITGTRVEIQLPKVYEFHAQGEFTATLQIDSRQPYTFDTVVVGTKVMWKGQSNAAMTEMLMNGNTGTPLLDTLVAHPNCRNVYLYHAITVSSVGALAPGSALTPQTDLPLPPTHGWINCESPGFYAAVKGTVLSGFSQSGLYLALETAELHQWLTPVMVYQLSAISTTLATWSSAEMIAEANVHSFITTPRNLLNTASSLWNGQIAPLKPFAFGAILRRQGESNALENKTEFGMLLPVWHNSVATFFRDPKLLIGETQLPPFVGSASIPTRYDGIRDGQQLAPLMRRESYLIPTSDLHDEVGRTLGDNGTHNIHNEVIGWRNAQLIGAEHFDMNINIKQAAVSGHPKMKYDGPFGSRVVEIIVKFSGVRSTGLLVLNTPGCEMYPGCATAKSPIEVRYGSKWVSVTDIFDPTRDYESVSGDTIQYTFATAGRAYFDGIRLTQSPYALKFLGDGNPAYPVRPFTYLMSAPSE